MIVAFISLVFLFLVAVGLLARRRPPSTPPGHSCHPSHSPQPQDSSKRLARADNTLQIYDIQALAPRHEVAWYLANLIEKDGAGDWPPRTDHVHWPAALRPYKDIYLELAPLLSAATPSLDDVVNTERREKYRGLMRKLLTERVNVDHVRGILSAVEAGNWDGMTREAYNGFYCCVAVCRHAYRWATIPVVKVAQLETIVEFPRELEVPWTYLQRMFGVTADSGNNTANVLHNFDLQGERVYKINVAMKDLIRESEEIFFRMFLDLEILGFPIYYSMVKALVAFDGGDKPACIRYLNDVSGHLRRLLSVFFDNVHGGRISPLVWLSYIQGFQGWGIGRYINGEYVKYDGLSGNHVLVFQAIDAFLGIERYLTDENMERYIPRNQRELCLAFKRHTLRSRLAPPGQNPEDDRIEEALQRIVRQLRVFRAAHRTRVIPYLEQPAPERLPMTAGKSVLNGSSLREALQVLDNLMVTRLRETQ
ncbi:hypothetical protein VTJ83DRAFT_1941 [Remersonia thermophila]|uniref:Indoleamine 2,3-dioxygenase n=1 Tax=Remersonia thermophila TaxID=72144 RepID=A0ABR4DHM6_9PEZI